MSERTPEILPKGKPIPFSDQKTLTIIRTISDKGGTAVVYEGLLRDNEGLEETAETVAVKAYRPFTDPARREREATTLQELMKATPSLADALGLEDFRPTPIYIGSGLYNGIPFIVMEYINGVEILAASTENRLAYPDKISAIWQFFAFLEIIHSKGQCFKDFKSENLVWTNNSRLRVLDVGDIVQSKSSGSYYGTPQYDLLKTSILLFKLLTGYGLKYSIQGLEERIEPLLAKRFSIDWGTNQFIRRCLGWKVDQHSLSANELRASMQSLVRYWEKADKELLDEALNKIHAAKNQTLGDINTHKELATEARAMLGIVQKRGSNETNGDDVDKAITLTERLLFQRDHLTIGKQFLYGGHYQQAKEQFEEGINLQSNDITRLRRWLYVAMMGLDCQRISLSGFETSISTLEKIIDGMEDGRFSDLQKTLPDPLVNTEGYQALMADFSLWESLQEGNRKKSEKNYAAAKKKFVEAKQHLNKLPSSSIVAQLETGNIDEYVVEMEHLSETVGRAQEEIKHGKRELQNKNIEEALKFYRTAANLAPDDVPVMNELTWAFRYCIENIDFAGAQQIADIGLNGLQPASDLLSYQRLPQEFQAAKNFLENGRTEDFISSLERIYVIYESNEEWKTAVKAAIARLTAHAEKILESEERPSELLSLVRLIRLIKDSEMEKRVMTQVHQLTERMKSIVDSYLVHANFLIHSEGPEVDRDLVHVYSPMRHQKYLRNRSLALQKAKHLLENALSISEYLNYKSNDIKDLLTDLNKMIESAKVSDEANTERGVAELNELESQWKNLSSKIDWYVSGPRDVIPSDIRDQIAKSMTRDISDFIIEIQRFLVNFESDNSRAHRMLEESLKRLSALGLPALQELKSRVEARINERAQELRTIEDDFNLGRIEDCFIRVNNWHQLEPDIPEWGYWKEKIARCNEFLKWQASHSVLSTEQLDMPTLKLIEEYTKMDLPKSVWMNGKARSYLENLDKSYKRKVRDSMHNLVEGEFLEAVRGWIVIKTAIAQLPCYEAPNEDPAPPFWKRIINNAGRKERFKTDAQE